MGKLSAQCNPAANARFSFCCTESSIQCLCNLVLYLVVAYNKLCNKNFIVTDAQPNGILYLDKGGNFTDQLSCPVRLVAQKGRHLHLRFLVSQTISNHDSLDDGPSCHNTPLIVIIIQTIVLLLSTFLCN